MGYVKVAYRNIFNKMDSYCLPKYWDKFVKKQEEKQNLIIKSNKNKCYCTNCKQYFISRKKVNEETKCPYCHNKYLIKRSNLKYYEFKDYLSILNKVDNTFVLSYFELKTVIDSKHNHNSSVVEFAREILNNNYYREVFVNNRVSKCQCYIYINHSNSSNINENKWREYTRNYSLIDYSIVFPNNLKKSLNNTRFEYSQIWNLVKKVDYINLAEIIKNYSNFDIKKIELFTKLKLYKLTLKTKYFKDKGTFYEIFGISKDYYNFMKKYNINYGQLKILRLLKEKDINKIRYLEKYLIYGDDTDNLEEIMKYISLNRFIKYSKKHKKKIDIYLYKDYLRFAKFLGFDLKNNRYAFPKNLQEEHDKLEKQYKINNKKIIRQAISKRSKELSVNTFKDKMYIIKPAPSLNSLKDESTQQGHCVRSYAERYAEGKCDIYFMRKLDSPNKSLVTVEVRNNRIMQSRIKGNYSPTDEQLKFLNKWEKKILKGVA